MSVYFDIFAYGLLMAVLSFAAWWCAPEHAWLFSFSGLVGGFSGIVWGILGARGYFHPRGTILTLAAVSALLLCVNFITWRETTTDRSQSLLASMVTTLMLVFSVGQAAYFWKEVRKSPASFKNSQKR